MKLSDLPQLKANFPGVTFIFRMGDFYEVLGDDARIVARQLGLTLTSRKSENGPIPMVGFPYHQIWAYSEKLKSLGHRLNIVEG